MMSTPRVAGSRNRLTAWLAARGYTGPTELRGILNRDHAPEPEAWSRLNYVQTLDGWRSVINQPPRP